MDGASNTAGAGAIEVELDLEMVSAIAPGASQLVYIGPNSSDGVNATYNQIVSDDRAKVTSISWSECESASGDSELSALDTIFQEGAAQGQAFFSASGDSGAYDCNDSNLAVDSPADDPYVTGVGGTNLQLSGNSYGSESVWSSPGDTQRSPEGAGGGGGYSSYFSKPAYQTGPGVNSSGMRQVPDVSADADPASGYSVYCTVSSASCSGWLTIGGTSAAAPLWAGVATDTNAYLASQGKSGLGNPNAELYTLFNTSQSYPAYHDVTSGNNLYYSAGPGYDVASGIGSPDAWNLARDAAGSGSGGTNDFSLSANPASLSIVQGSSGSSTISTAVTSGTASTVNLSASVSPSGPTVSLSPTSVSAGNSATLTVNVGAPVASDIYTVTVTGTEGSTSHRTTVTVAVGSGGGGSGMVTNGGFESGDLSGWTCDSPDAVVSSPVHSGSHALEVAPTSFTTGECDQTISVQANHTYTLSAYVDGSYAYLGVQGGASNWTSSGSYTKLSVTFTTGATQTSVTIYIQGWYAQSSIYVDDVSLN